MSSLFQFSILLPIVLVLIQTVLIILAGLWLLRKIKILKMPYAGMEYGEVIVAAGVMFSTLLISSSNVLGIFQAFKTYQNVGIAIAANTFSWFSKSFLVVVFFEGVFVLIVWLALKIIYGSRKTLLQVENGGIPASLLAASTITGLAVTVKLCSVQILEYITPQFVSIR